MEFTTGVLFSLVTWGWHGSIVSAGYCILAATMVAVGLIEYGGERAPLSIAAIGTASAQAVLLVAGGWHHWSVAIGSLAGSIVALLAITALRSVDPDCTDPRQFGRSTLLVAGCWLGGLMIVPAVLGGVAWIVAYVVCMMGAWWIGRRRPTGPPSIDLSERALPPVLATPLVTALTVAMATSLVARF